jgi:hypothetical protein
MSHKSKECDNLIGGFRKAYKNFFRVFNRIYFILFLKLRWKTI